MGVINNNRTLVKKGVADGTEQAMIHYLDQEWHSLVINICVSCTLMRIICYGMLELFSVNQHWYIKQITVANAAEDTAYPVMYALGFDVICFVAIKIPIRVKWIQCQVDQVWSIYHHLPGLLHCTEDWLKACQVDPRKWR